MNLVNDEAEALRLVADVAAINRDVRGARVEIVPVDCDRVEAIDCAFRPLFGAAVVGNLVVVQVERERGGVVCVRQVLDL